MNVKSVEKEATRASVTVELTREELEPALNRAYLKYRKDIMIPCFRKGHAYGHRGCLWQACLL